MVGAPVQTFGMMLCTADDRLLKSLTVKKNWALLATARSSAGFRVLSDACRTTHTMAAAPVPVLQYSHCAAAKHAGHPMHSCWFNTVPRALSRQ